MADEIIPPEETAAAPVVPRRKTLSFLQPGMLIRYDGRAHQVITVNDSRAVIRAVERKTIAATEDAGIRTVSERDIGISPNSEVEVLGYV